MPTHFRALLPPPPDTRSDRVPTAYCPVLRPPYSSQDYAALRPPRSLASRLAPANRTIENALVTPPRTRRRSPNRPPGSLQLSPRDFNGTLEKVDRLIAAAQPQGSRATE